MTMPAENDRTFDELIGRLDDIVETVRRKDTTLERSLDLLDEAITVGLAAVDMVDTSAFSPAEQGRVNASAPASESAAAPVSE